jgi:hypothetical protein
VHTSTRERRRHWAIPNRPLLAKSPKSLERQCLQPVGRARRRAPTARRSRRRHGLQRTALLSCRTCLHVVYILSRLYCVIRTVGSMYASICGHLRSTITRNASPEHTPCHTPCHNPCHTPSPAYPLPCTCPAALPSTCAIWLDLHSVEVSSVPYSPEGRRGLVATEHSPAWPRHALLARVRTRLQHARFHMSPHASPIILAQYSCAPVSLCRTLRGDSRYELGDFRVVLHPQKCNEKLNSDESRGPSRESARPGGTWSPTEGAVPTQAGRVAVTGSGTNPERPSCVSALALLVWPLATRHGATVHNLRVTVTVTSQGCLPP